MTVGDSGSTDASIDVLSRLERRGWLSVEHGPGTKHAEWIDGWRQSVTEDLVVFADSDVEFRRKGWLKQMVQHQVRTSAAVVTAELLGESHGSYNPLCRTTVRGMVRAAPWLVMLDRRQTADVETSFLYDEFDSDEVPEGRIAYDVGGRFFEAVVARGLGVSEMPRRHRRTWHHYAGMSWVPPGGARGDKKAHDLRVARSRLARLRRLQDEGGLRNRVALATLAAPEVTELTDIWARGTRRLKALARATSRPQ